MSHDHIVMGQPNTAQKSLISTVVGFVISIVLTFIAFWLVEKHAMRIDDLYGLVSVLAVIQILVQLFFFLRLNSGMDGAWNIATLIFTVIVILIVVVGSLWIMYNLNYNMVH